MKKILVSISALVLTFSGFAQTEAREMSPAETFAARKEAILEKHFDEVGKVGSLNVQLEYLIDLSNNDKLQCIRFDIVNKNNSIGPSALLDSNEVNEIITFLKYLSANVINKRPPHPNTEISITTKYDIQVGCYSQPGNGWSIFLRTDAKNPTTETEINWSDVDYLIKTLALAKTRMERL
jgi:hypothetical protein